MGDSLAADCGPGMKSDLLLLLLLALVFAVITPEDRWGYLQGVAWLALLMGIGAMWKGRKLSSHEGDTP